MARGYQYQASPGDAIAAATLILVGFGGLIARLDVFQFSNLRWFASAAAHWWPTVLVVVGAALWLAERTLRREATQMSREITYGR